MTTEQPQNQSFTEALKSWMAEHYLDATKAAKYFQISRRDIEQYLAGAMPDNERMAWMLGRIGKEGE